MTDAAFAKGMGLLSAVFPNLDEDPAVKNTRGMAYRKTLDHLSDEAFLFGVSLALKHEKRWFPTPAMLIDYADEYEPPQPLLPSGRTPEQLEAEREAARGNIRSGAELVRAELIRLRLLAPDAPEPVADMPKARA